MNRSRPLLDVLLHHELIPSAKSKNTVVFLHGLMGNGNNLKTLAKKLSQQHCVSALLMDLRGHGKSPSTDQNNEPATLNNCAKDVLFTLKSLGYNDANSPVSIVGHRYGTFMTICFLSLLFDF